MTHSIPVTPLIDPADRHKIAVHFYTPPTVAGQPRPRILLLKLDHIGDFVAALKAFSLLRQAFADAEITLICLPVVVALAESTGLFDKVKGFAAVPDSAQLGQVAPPVTDEQISAFRALLDEPYFLAADFRHDPFNRFGLDHVDARYRAAFTAQTQRGLDIVIPIMEWDAPVARVEKGVNLPPAADVRLTLLAHAIIETLRPHALGVEFSEGIETPAYHQLQSIKRFKIGLSIGAGSELRQWPTEHWQELIRQLAQSHDAHFVFFGAEADHAGTRAVAAALPPDRVTDLTGAISLAQIPTFMKLLDIYTGCDTGLTHLAAHLGLPVVEIFAGISNISVWAARGPRVKTAYAGIACAPCHKRLRHECPNGNACMTVITPEKLLEAFEQVIAF